MDDWTCEDCDFSTGDPEEAREHIIDEEHKVLRRDMDPCLAPERTSTGFRS